MLLPQKQNTVLISTYKSRTFEQLAIWVRACYYQFVPMVCYKYSFTRNIICKLVKFMSKFNVERLENNITEINYLVTNYKVYNDCCTGAPKRVRLLICFGTYTIQELCDTLSMRSLRYFVIRM